MKKICLTAFVLFSLTTVFADDPPVKNGDKCNVNNQNGRIHSYTQERNNSNNNSSNLNGGGKAGTNIMGIGLSGKVEADKTESVSNTSRTVDSGFQCVTNEGRFDYWNDGELTK